MGPPSEPILQLKERYKLKDFIETGTFHGSTAVWAASHFDNVITIEFSKEIYDQTVAKYGNKIQNINFLFGDSRSVLKTVVPKLTHPAIFWLDSHWSGGQTYGKNDECSLIEELRMINLSKYAHFLFIDDARLFMSPPPMPHLIEQWPSIDEVIDALKSGNHEFYIVLFEDVVIAVPEYAKELVANYCQDINTKAWEEYGKRLNESAIKQGCRLIVQGMKLVGYDLIVKARRRIHLKK
ncbi:hypothetical protein C5S53_00465 [Methanophagales archaeon]|nr:hypothetical protein C5S53_00465 [Methanophagales archaeon]